MAPINLPDGTEVSEIVLPDGTTASEVLAPDESTVFGNAIPDTSMFSNVVAHYNAGLGGVSDGNVGDFEQIIGDGPPNGSPIDDPTFNSAVSDSNSVEHPAYYYDGGADADNDSHDMPTKSSNEVLPDGNTSWSIFGLVNINSFGTRNSIIEYDDIAILARDGGWIVGTSLFTNLGFAGTTTTNLWTTFGLIYDSVSSEVNFYANGGSSSIDSTSGSFSVNNSNFVIGEEATRSRRPFDGYVAEVIVSQTNESGTAYDNYHTDRIA